jgi:hypothetical protein
LQKDSLVTYFHDSRLVAVGQLALLVICAEGIQASPH